MTIIHPKGSLLSTQRVIKMNGFQLLAAIFTLNLLMTALTSADKQSVNIINQVGGAIDLQCGSRDNDLGLRILGNQQTFFFDFHQNFFGNTLFWCNFQWQQRKAHIVVWKGHGSSGLDWTPCDQCVWVLKPNGFYRGQAARISNSSKVGNTLHFWSTPILRQHKKQRTKARVFHAPVEQFSVSL